MAQTDITSLQKAGRTFKPSAAFAKQAHVKSLAQYRKLYAESIKSPAKFWPRMAKELHWFKRWKNLVEWNEPFAKWFVGGQINLSYNCLDRHLDGPRRNKAAIIWEGEPAGFGNPGETRVLTYIDLHRETCRFANVLKRNGVVKATALSSICQWFPKPPSPCSRARVLGRRIRSSSAASAHWRSSTASTIAARRWSSPPTAGITVETSYH